MVNVELLDQLDSQLDALQFRCSVQHHIDNRSHKKQRITHLEFCQHGKQKRWKKVVTSEHLSDHEALI